MTCQICNTKLENIPTDNIEGTFIHYCSSCNLLHQKLPVGTIINEFSNNTIYRYLKLIVLNMVNTLPIHQLYEFYIINQEALTVEEYNNLLMTYKTKRESDGKKSRLSL